MTEIRSYTEQDIIDLERVRIIRSLLRRKVNTPHEFLEIVFDVRTAKDTDPKIDA